MFLFFLAAKSSKDALNDISSCLFSLWNKALASYLLERGNVVEQVCVCGKYQAGEGDRSDTQNTRKTFLLNAEREKSVTVNHLCFRFC